LIDIDNYLISNIIIIIVNYNYYY